MRAWAFFRIKPALCRKSSGLPPSSGSLRRGIGFGSMASGHDRPTGWSPAMKREEKKKASSFTTCSNPAALRTPAANALCNWQLLSGSAKGTDGGPCCLLPWRMRRRISAGNPLSLFIRWPRPSRRSGFPECRIGECHLRLSLPRTGIHGSGAGRPDEPGRHAVCPLSVFHFQNLPPGRLADLLAETEAIPTDLGCGWLLDILDEHPGFPPPLRRYWPGCPPEPEKCWTWSFPFPPGNSPIPPSSRSIPGYSRIQAAHGRSGSQISCPEERKPWTGHGAESSGVSQPAAFFKKPSPKNAERLF